LRKLIGRIRPEILHTWCEPATTLGLLASQGARTARVLASEHQSLAGIHRPQWFYRQLCRKAEAFVVPHETLRGELIDKGVDPAITRVIPNGIEVATTNGTLARHVAREKIAADWDVPQSAFVAATVACFEPATRIKDLIWVTDTFTCFRDDVYFFLIGEGPQRWRLTRFLHSTNAQANTRIVGDGERAIEYFPGLDVYWHSHHEQPIPSGILLAMANAVPVISVYGPGTCGLIQHQKTGLAVNTGSRVEFGRWTKYLIEQPAMARQLGTQGQDHVARHYDANAMANSYVQLYESR
jgi:glycosyltransferase involved in cell wall biosynthesis